MLRKVLLWASGNDWLRERVPQYRFARRAVRRFMPGETLEDALVAAEQFQERGLASVLTQLGENISGTGEAEAETAHYENVLRQSAERDLDGEISVKLTHLGLDVDGGAGLAFRNLMRLVRAAERTERFVWIDMEQSRYVDTTLNLYRRARESSSRVGVCLQAYLRRTPEDLNRLLPLAPAIRLVKGAYAEPRDVAYPKKRDVDVSYLELGRTILRDIARGASVRAGFGTHDMALIERLQTDAMDLELPRDAFEVQMLYGIGREAQERLTRDGWRVRILISYGDAWYPWYLRRLAERPANIGFVLRSMVTR